MNQAAAIQDAENAGFDLSLIDANLRLTPEQRVLKHQQALALAEEMTRAGKQLRDRAETAAAAASQR
jgi:hypothetical protein